VYIFVVLSGIALLGSKWEMGMTLQCSETGKGVRYGTTLLAATTTRSAAFYALSQDAAEQIPQDARSAAFLSDGLNVYAASSGGPTLGDCYTLGGFCVGVFVFALSSENAEMYLPNLWQKIER
jgi:hypothetical protein